ncbi:hypothetical protein GJ496_009075 [Pomphorhynchus laevis]|nr:hypothetical protein GJ496_009075 [Pomphorhynchus laevis]
MKRVFTGIQPTGVPHIGHYFGVISQLISMQYNNIRPIVMIADLHSLTSGVFKDHDYDIRRRSRLLTAALLASGVDPLKTTIYRQSDISAHSELFWILCNFVNISKVASVPTYQDVKQNDSVSMGRFAYAVLQAADILLLRATDIPIGKDQIPHIELCRDIAAKFNKRCSTDVFKIPTPIIDDEYCCCLKSLRDPSKKMSKSDPDRNSCVFLSDTNLEIERKVRLALTDSLPNITFDLKQRPALHNLLTIEKMLTGKSQEDLHYESIQQLKQSLTMNLTNLIEPIRTRIESYDSRYLEGVLLSGRAFVSKLVTETMSTVRRALGYEL